MSKLGNKHSRRIMQKIELEIPEMNNNAITEIVGGIHQADFETLAETIAIMRAKYLRKVINIARLDKSDLDVKDFTEVHHLKLAFEEAITSFHQLKKALEHGHFELSDK